MTDPQKYVASTSLPVSVQEAFAYHERAGALERLIPPWESVAIESSDGSLEVGSRVVLKTRIAGFPLRWVAEHTEYDPPNEFADRQVSGPFKQWDHQHLFRQSGDEQCLLCDSVRYRLPLGNFGKLFGGGIALRAIETMFAYRHRVTRDDLALSAAHSTPSLTVAVSGSSGLVGSQLCTLLSLLGHDVRPIARAATGDRRAIAAWSDPAETKKFSDVDVVVHLAGKSIAAGRWTDATKRQIHESRVIKTRELCESIAKLDDKPSVLVCASATGLYGDRADQILDESSSPGEDFLAEVAKEWELACRPAVEAGIRVVNARFGIILTPRGGALSKMLLPAKLAGGALGSGNQWWSWIALDDVLGALYQAMVNNSIVGPVNMVSPEPIMNRDFARTLASVLGRPALLPAPAPMLRLALGEMADALLLASTRVVPGKLTDSGYKFRFTDLADCLRYSLGKDRLESSS